jgi:hypothetical protein
VSGVQTAFLTFLVISRDSWKAWKPENSELLDDILGGGESLRLSAPVFIVRRQLTSTRLCQSFQPALPLLMRLQTQLRSLIRLSSLVMSERGLAHSLAESTSTGVEAAVDLLDVDEGTEEPRVEEFLAERRDGRVDDAWGKLT